MIVMTTGKSFPHIILCIIISSAYLTQIHAEYFSSVDSLHTLSDIETKLVDIFREHLKEQQEEVAKLRKYVENVRNQLTYALEDADDYLGNPINAFTLIKRMASDWNYLHNFVNQTDEENAYQIYISTLGINFPDLQDLRGAVKGLARLQKVYNLNSTELKYGLVNGVDYGTELNWHDCFVIATNLFEEKEFSLAILWFAETLQLIENDDEEHTEVEDIKPAEINDEDNEEKEECSEEDNECAEEYNDEKDEENMCEEVNEDLAEDFEDTNENNEKTDDIFEDSSKEIEHELVPENKDKDIKLDTNKIVDAVKRKFELETYEYLALANYELGKVNEALAIADMLLDMEPNHSIRHTKMYMQLNKPKPIPFVYDYKSLGWYRNYTELCKGNYWPEPEPHRLECKLETKNKPIFYLAPLRMEVISEDPEIALYHGLLTDKQINSIVEQAEDNMHRSMVVGTNGSLVNDVRVSQQAWLNYTSTEMQTIHRLISDIGGLTMDNAEIMQMANYGIGGLYEPHMDTFDVLDPNWEGNRITTNMFYLSDVEQGGYTVFPKLNLFLRPIKGSLVIWYNLHKSTDVDRRMMHAGCPIIKGSKRIGNIWIHSGKQEFRRPCDLLNDNYKSVAYI